MLIAKAIIIRNFIVIKGGNTIMVETENKKTAGESLKGGDVFSDAMLNEYTKKLKTIKPGVIVKGKIVSIRPNYVVVDVGYKSEGLISRSEFLDVSIYKPGDEVDVLVRNVEDREGFIVLSKQEADRIQNWSKMVKAQGDGANVKGRIVKKVKGGYLVDVGMEAFLPSSQVDVRPVDDSKTVEGQIFEFKVVKVDDMRKNIVLSRRNLLEEAQKKDKAELLKTLKIGDIRKGIIKNITDFGAFIDLKGIDGLLHITDMTWGRISHPSEMFAVGDEIEVVIINIDKEKEKVSLGLKQITQNPWQDVEKKYPIGSRVKGRIVNIVQYGAFVELEKGVEGLIHVSELSWTKRVNNPSEMLAIGDIVEAMVLSIDKDARRISLGIKQIEPNPWSLVAEKYPVGTKVSGKVRNITNYGVFVELAEGIDGLIHISDLSWTKKIENPSEILKKGDVVEVKVISVDPVNQRIALGLKQLQQDPWEGVEGRYAIGLDVDGKVTKVAPFGAFVEIEPGVEGLVHTSQIPDSGIKEGDTVISVIMNVSQKDRKIGLTIKEINPNKSNG
jgi:small subunit ribosomal protein S1